MTPDILEQAAHWHTRVNAGLSPADERLLDAWLARDLRHRLAYADVAAAGFALEQATTPAAHAAPRRTRHWPAWVVAALAPLLLFVLLRVPHVWEDLQSDMHTPAGQLSTRTLPDGSTLQLDTDSAVRLSFAADHRDVELLRGALSVQVAKDSTRPFRVRCAGSTATAVGTRFVVARHNARLELGVGEGRVTLATPHTPEPLEIVAGQRAVVADGRVSVHESSPTDDGWTRGVLSFDRVPLALAIEEVGRYVPEKMVVRAPSALSTVITANLPLGDPHAALAALTNANGLRTRRLPGLIVITEG